MAPEAIGGSGEMIDDSMQPGVCSNAMRTWGKCRVNVRNSKGKQSCLGVQVLKEEAARSRRHRRDPAASASRLRLRIVSVMG